MERVYQKREIDLSKKDVKTLTKKSSFEMLSKLTDLVFISIDFSDRYNFNDIHNIFIQSLFPKLLEQMLG